MSNELKIKPTFTCPVCGEHDFGYAHLLTEPSKEVYTWSCAHCVSDISFSLKDNTTPVLEKVKSPEEGKAFLLALLRLDTEETLKKPIFIVVKVPNYTHETDLEKKKHQLRYYFDEHTCPSNYLHVTIIEGDDDDPHGIFNFVDAVWVPNDFCWSEFRNSGGDYSTLFPCMRNRELNDVALKTERPSSQIAVVVCKNEINGSTHIVANVVEIDLRGFWIENEELLIKGIRHMAGCENAVSVRLLPEGADLDDFILECLGSVDTPSTKG